MSETIIGNANNDAGIPHWYSNTDKYNDNNDSNNIEFDMNAIASNEWIYGNSEINTQLTWKFESAITYS